MKKIQKKCNGTSCTVYFPNDNRYQMYEIFVHCEILLLKEKTNASVTYGMKSGILRHFQNGSKIKSLQDKVAFYSSFRSLFC